MIRVCSARHARAFYLSLFAAACGQPLEPSEGDAVRAPDGGPSVPRDADLPPSDAAQRAAPSDEPELTRCGVSRLPELRAACTADELGVRAVKSAPPGSEHLARHRLALGELSAVSDLAGGPARVSFVTEAAGEYAVYTSVPTVAAQVFAEGTQQVPLCGVYVSDARARAATGGDCRVRNARIYELGASTAYVLEVDGRGNDAVNVLVQHECTPGSSGAEDRDAGLGCAPDELRGLADTCAVCADAEPLRGEPIGSDAPPQIEPGVAYGVRLAELSGKNESELVFVAPRTGDFLVGLGSGAVPISVLAESTPVQTACSGTVSASERRAAAADECDPVRAVRRVSLRAGERARILVGRTEAAAWLRVAVTEAGQ